MVVRFLSTRPVVRSGCWVRLLEVQRRNLRPRQRGVGGPAGIFGCRCWSRGMTAVNAQGLMEAVILPAITVSIKPRAMHIDHTPPL